MYTYVTYTGPENERILTLADLGLEGDHVYQWHSDFARVQAVDNDHLERVLSVPLMRESTQEEIDAANAAQDQREEDEKNRLYRESRARATIEGDNQLLPEAPAEVADASAGDKSSDNQSA